MNEFEGERTLRREPTLLFVVGGNKEENGEVKENGLETEKNRRIGSS